MNNQFITQAVDIVTQAITADKEGEYDQALALYRKSLDYFMTGLKYEKNPAARERVMEKVEGYMQRAEFLKNSLADNKSGKSSGGGGGAATASKDQEGKQKEDDETGKMRGALSSAIISEKPDVKWSDVAGLEMAKEALKEAVILPIRFPQFFTGKRKPWKGILLYGPVRRRMPFLLCWTNILLLFWVLCTTPRSARHRQVLSRQGSGHRGGQHLLRGVLLGSSVQVAGRVREAREADVRDGSGGQAVHRVY